jgi:hypothetical protein
MNNLQPISKALAGAVVSALVAYLGQHGVILNDEVTGAVSVLVAALLAFVVVYLSPANKTKK